MPQLRKPQDRKIWPTIHKIALDFIDTYGEDVVLLYHCAHKDNRHPFRNKLFLKWERLVDGPDSEMLRMSQTYQIGQNQSNPLDYAYLGAITSKRNPDIDLINREFDQFGVELLSGRK